MSWSGLTGLLLTWKLSTHSQLGEGGGRGGGGGGRGGGGGGGWGWSSKIDCKEAR